MPIITISMFTGKTPDEKKTLCTDIKNTIKKSFDIAHDNFHFRINEYNRNDLYVPESSTEKYLLIEIQLLKTRTFPEKEVLYKQMEEALLKHSILSNDFCIVLSFPPADNWFIRGMTGIEINKRNTNQ